MQRMKKALGSRRMPLAIGAALILILTLRAMLTRGDAFYTAQTWVQWLPQVACVAAVALAIRYPAIGKEKLFIILALGLGAGYLLAITPLSPPDETFHYQAALTASSRLLHGACALDASYLSGQGFTGHANTREAFLTMVEGLSAGGLTGEVVPFEPVTVNSWLMYLPQIAGTSLALSLGLNRQWVFLLGRLMNLACYTGLTFLAVRRMPKGQLMLMLCALTPMALQQAASLSPDGMLNGLAFLGTALMLSAVLNTKRMSAGEGAALAVTAMLLAPAKAVYFPMLLLVLWIPKARFRRKAHKWCYALGVLAASALVTVAIQAGNLATSVGHGADSPFYTLGWVLGHPVQAVKIVVSTLAPSAILWLIETAVGSQLSGLSLELALGSIWCYIMLLLFAAVCRPEEDRPLARGLRGYMLALVILVVGAVFGVMLLSWTPVGSSVVEGVQGRYFLPVLPMALLCLNGGGVVTKRNYDGWSLGAWCLLAVYSLYQVGAATGLA